ncbi:MAG: hypothetical protein AAFY35_18360 [Pseudomonadota bacterium]
MSSTLPLWAEGPAELLEYGLSLVSEDSGPKRRIAMILIDNAAELTMKTYISLPKRVTGLDLSRKERDDFCKNFPSLLDGIEAHAEEKTLGLDLGEFEWFHKLRNQLYHDGNGITVEHKTLQVYAELCKNLFKALFDVDLEVKSPADSDERLIAAFFEAWMKIERLLLAWAPDERKSSPSQAILGLHEEGEISDDVVMVFGAVQRIRNELVHGEAEVVEMLRPANMAKVHQLELAVMEMADRKLSIRRKERF